MELTSSRPPKDAASSPPTVTTAVHATRSQTGSQCSGCGARLAGDQRYCTECGRRTGEARPTLMREPGQLAAAPQPTAAAVSTAAPRSIRNAPGGVLLAGIAVLLLAMGVGVLIGNTGNGKNATAAAPPTILTAAPAAAVTGTTPSAVAPASAATATDAATSKKAKRAAKKAAKAAKAAAATAAAKTPAVVKPAAGKKVKLGDKGSGPGYDKKSGTFTGNFFGP